MCKNIANRIQMNLVQFVEMPHILCKNIANRIQLNLVQFVEM